MHFIAFFSLAWLPLLSASWSSTCREISGARWFAQVTLEVRAMDYKHLESPLGAAVAALLGSIQLHTPAAAWWPCIEKARVTAPTRVSTWQAKSMLFIPSDTVPLLHGRNGAWAKIKCLSSGEERERVCIKKLKKKDSDNIEAHLKVGRCVA